MRFFSVPLSKVWDIASIFPNPWRFRIGSVIKKKPTKMWASSWQVEGDQEQMLIVHAFCCLHGFIFLTENKFDSILTTFMLQFSLALVSSFFRQLISDILCPSTVPLFSPCPIFRTIYLLLQSFVSPFFYAVDTVRFCNDFSYDFGGGKYICCYP